MAFDVLILGGGESGVGAAILAQKNNLKVLLSDAGKLKEEYRKVLLKHNINFEEEGHQLAAELNAKLIIKSPGIPEEAKLVKTAKDKGIPVISEIEFAARYTRAKIIAITGTNGKTTTASLVHHILKKAGLDVMLAGNIGDSFAKQVAESDADWAVLEVSSFQLDGCFDFKPLIAMLLNITPDHLDRYQNNYQLYADAKMRIAQSQDENDHFIYCIDSEAVLEALERNPIRSKCYAYSVEKEVAQGASLKDKNTIETKIDNNITNMSIHELALQGKHNISNSMAGSIAARIIEIRKEVIRDSLADFQNVEHRLEYVTTVSGVEYINDSKATNVNSTWYALESMQNQTVWIVGGVDKGNDYDQLKELVAQKVKTIICLGEQNDKIIDAFGDVIEEIYTAKSMPEAVYFGYQAAKKGDTVLLSPACASFDLFENYEDRGRQFKESVRGL